MIWIAGDSTARAGNGGESNGKWGWGDKLQPHVGLVVVNAAKSGRSSRSYLAEGNWNKIVEEGKPGDYVLIQFGHNDSSPNHERWSLPGFGEETENSVHTFGWYLRSMVRQAKEHRLKPILLSPTRMRNGQLLRDYREWTRKVAKQESVPFMDVFAEARPAPSAYADEVHPTSEGAELIAGVVAKLLAKEGIPPSR